MSRLFCGILLSVVLPAVAVAIRGLLPILLVLLLVVVSFLLGVPSLVLLLGLDPGTLLALHPPQPVHQSLVVPLPVGEPRPELLDHLLHRHVPTHPHQGPGLQVLPVLHLLHSFPASEGEPGQGVPVGVLQYLGLLQVPVGLPGVLGPLIVRALFGLEFVCLPGEPVDGVDPGLLHGAAQPDQGVVHADQVQGGRDRGRGRHCALSLQQWQM